MIVVKVNDMAYKSHFIYAFVYAVLQYLMFNSVPMDFVAPAPMQTLNSKEERIKCLLKYFRRFGVPEEFLFNEADLFDFKNVPKVTRCVAMLAKMAKVPAFESLDVQVPDEDDIYYEEDEDI